MRRFDGSMLFVSAFVAGFGSMALLGCYSPSQRGEALLSLQRGRHLLLSEDWSAAIQEYRFVLERTRTISVKAEALFAVGKCYLALGETGKGVQALKAVLKLDYSIARHGPMYNNAHHHACMELSRHYELDGKTEVALHYARLTMDRYEYTDERKELYAVRRSWKEGRIRRLEKALREPSHGEE